MPVHFDGTDARISTTDTVGALIALPITLACVVRFDTINRWHGLLSLAAHNVSRGCEWEVDSSNKLYYANNASLSVARSTATTIAAATWYFIGTSVTSTGAGGLRHFVYNLETRAILFDESLGGMLYNALSAGDDYTIGAWADTPTVFGDFLDGQIAWIAVYDKNYNSTNAMLTLATLGPYALDIPVAFWPLLDGVDGATSTVAREWSNNNTGTLTNVNFDANGGWRAMSLPGPWWITRAARTRKAAAAAPVAYTPKAFLLNQAVQRAATY